MSNEFAFPGKIFINDEGQRLESFNEGMTLRQWYAGMALQGLVSSLGPMHEKGPLIAKWSFQLADVMIEESKK